MAPTFGPLVYLHREPNFFAGPVNIAEQGHWRYWAAVKTCFRVHAFSMANSKKSSIGQSAETGVPPALMETRWNSYGNVREDGWQTIPGQHPKAQSPTPLESLTQTHRSPSVGLDFTFVQVLVEFKIQLDAVPVSSLEHR
jgi:hypothetical protein